MDTYALEMTPIPAPAISRPTVRRLLVSMAPHSEDMHTHAEDPTTTIWRTIPIVTKTQAENRPPFLPEKSLLVSLRSTRRHEFHIPDGTGEE